MMPSLYLGFWHCISKIPSFLVVNLGGVNTKRRWRAHSLRPKILANQIKPK